MLAMAYWRSVRCQCGVHRGRSSNTGHLTRPRRPIVVISPGSCSLRWRRRCRPAARSARPPPRVEGRRPTHRRPRIRPPGATTTAASTPPWRRRSSSWLRCSPAPRLACWPTRWAYTDTHRRWSSMSCRGPAQCWLAYWSRRSLMRAISMYRNIGVW